MRKIILFVTFILLISVSIQGASAAWYGAHAVYHGAWGATECNDDGDTRWGVWDTAQGKDHQVYSWDGATSWNMYCQYWDGAAPSCGTWTPNPASWRNTTQTFTLSSSSDVGGSSISTAGGTCNTSTNGGTCTVTISDGAGNTTNCTSPAAKIDTTAPTASANNVTNTWVNTNIGITLYAGDAWGSGLASAQYSWDNSNCWAGPSYSNGSTITLSTEWGHTLYLCVRDGAGNTGTWNGAYYLDKTAPAISDIANSNAANLLAHNAYVYSISVNSNGMAPIVSITAKSEDSGNQLTTTSRTSSSSSLTFTWDISNVDRDRQANGGRQYTFTVTQICDVAGNCWNGTQAYNYDIYADTSLASSITTKTTVPSEVTSLAWGTLIADGIAHPLNITLGDKYGNQIVPATGIGRTIDFNFNTNNGLYLNQYSRTGVRSVFTSIPSASTTYTNRFAIGTNQTTSFAGQPSNNGTYPFNFKLYTPTYQNYKADPNGKFKINSVTFNINWSLGAIVAQSVANSIIDFNFKPLYETVISGDLRDGGFIEGAQQDSLLSLNTNNPSVNGTNPIVQLEFSGADSNKVKLYGGTTPWLADVTGHQITIHADILSPMTFPSSSINLSTLLLQNPWTIVGNPLKTSLSTHLSYTLDGNSVFYNSDIVGKDNYFATDTGSTQQTGLKIFGLVSTKKSQELVTNQFAYNINILGNSDKFNNKTDIIKNAFKFLSNASIGDQSSKSITNLSGNNTYGKNFPTGTNSSVLYFWNLSNTNVTLGNGTNDVVVSGKRTILIVWGNLYIKNNIYYNSLSQDILGIIVLKDKAGNGGNIYLDPSVTNITGTLFSEKSIINYDGTKELDGNAPLNTLKNQLLIYGNVFSENTTGGSRKSTPQCAFYVPRNSCTLSVAQKYDLNYLRRYYLVGGTSPYGNGKVIGWGTCNNTTTCSWHNPNLSQTRIFTTTTDKYAPYPVIIEYNPNIQKLPPPLFNLTNKN